MVKTLCGAFKPRSSARSLADFAKIVEVLDAQCVSFVAVTQQFNTTTSMGRLTLNVLLSFAQFEREIAGERIRDKIKASRQKGMWMGGNDSRWQMLPDALQFGSEANRGRRVSWLPSSMGGNQPT